MNVKIEIIINGESVSCSSPVVSSDTPVVSSDTPVVSSEPARSFNLPRRRKCFTIFDSNMSKETYNLILLPLMGPLGGSLFNVQEDLYSPTYRRNVSFYEVEFPGIFTGMVVSGIKKFAHQVFDDIHTAKKSYGIN